MSIYLKDATYIDWKTFELKNGHIRVDEEEGGSFEFVDILPYNYDLTVGKVKGQIIDCENRLVVKSFVNAHHHVYSALARGMGAPKKSPENFQEILKYIWWTLDKNLDEEMIEYSALVTAMASAKNGVTYVIDHHASPFAVEGSLEIIADAFDRVGISNLLCYEISDRDGPEIAKKGLAETEAYIKSGRQGLVGLHASFTVGDSLLKKAVDLAEKTDSGIHIHVAEDETDQDDCQKKYKMRVVERLYNAGILDFPKTILGHCLHLSNNEKERIQSSNAFVVQNAESNLNNNVGIFNGEGLGDRIMLGTDGMHSDMLRSAQAAYLVGQISEGVSPLTVYHRFWNAHNYLKTNGFADDRSNSLVVLNYDSPTKVDKGNFLAHFIYGLNSNHVEHVISNGKLVVKNRKIMTVDENEILVTSRELGKKLWKKMSQ